MYKNTLNACRKNPGTSFPRNKKCNAKKYIINMFVAICCYLLLFGIILCYLVLFVAICYYSPSLFVAICYYLLLFVAISKSIRLPVMVT